MRSNAQTNQDGAAQSARARILAVIRGFYTARSGLAWSALILGNLLTIGCVLIVFGMHVESFNGRIGVTVFMLVCLTFIADIFSLAVIAIVQAERFSRFYKAHIERHYSSYSSKIQAILEIFKETLRTPLRDSMERGGSLTSKSEIGHVTHSNHINTIRSTEDASTSYTGEAANPINIDSFVRKLQNVLVQEPVMDGFKHPAEPILVRAFAREPEKLGHWFQKLMMDDSEASNSADILRLLARFKPDRSEWRREILRVALGSRSPEVRDAAIQAVESWAEPELTDLLRLHTETAPWLAEYAAQVVRDLTV